MEVVSLAYCNLIIPIGVNNELLAFLEGSSKFGFCQQEIKRLTDRNVVIKWRKDYVKQASGPSVRITITHDKDIIYDNKSEKGIVNIAERALAKANELNRDVFIIGEADVYRAFLDSKSVDQIFLIRLVRSFKSAQKSFGVYTDFLDLSDWKLVESTEMFADGMDIVCLIYRPIE